MGGFAAQQRVFGVRHSWMAKGGLRLKQLEGLVRQATEEDRLRTPDIVIIHAGGNDMIPGGRVAVREALFEALSRVRKRWPVAKIF